MNAVVSPLSALGRLLIALIFVRAGINKLGTIATTAATMGSHGILYRIFWFGAPLSSKSAGG